MFSTEDEPADAISAVKALSKANALGQRIYELTPANMAETLPNLNLARETEDEIRTALNAGLTVIAHTDPMEVPGWRGAGYIIFDSDTGDGAYKISGGQNGGFSKIDGSISFVALFTEVVNDISKVFRQVISRSLGTIFGTVFDFLDISRACPGFESIAGVALTGYVSNVLTNLLVGSLFAGGVGIVVGFMFLITTLIIVSFLTDLIKQAIIYNCINRDG
jgi:hypothetical protein